MAHAAWQRLCHRPWITDDVKWISGKRLGLQTHLAQNAKEQTFVNSLSVYTSNWIRIEFYSSQVYTDDDFRGNSLTITMKVLYCQVELKQNMLLLWKYAEFRPGHLWTLGWRAFYCNKKSAKISNQYCGCILARIGFDLLLAKWNE